MKFLFRIRFLLTFLEFHLLFRLLDRLFRLISGLLILFGRGFVFLRCGLVACSSFTFLPEQRFEDATAAVGATFLGLLFWTGVRLFCFLWYLLDTNILLYQETIFACLRHSGFRLLELLEAIVLIVGRRVPVVFVLGRELVTFLDFNGTCEHHVIQMLAVLAIET